MKPAILTHGGAGAWPEALHQEAMDGMSEATAAGWEILLSGGSALDAVEKAANILEDNPVYDAGVGSFLNNRGEVEMDALIVDGSTLNFGAVAAVRHVRYPITLARRVMLDTPHCFFVGEGADMLAVQMGLPVVSNLFFVTDRNLEFYRQQNTQAVSTGTIGAVAIDAHGHVASATSTGGTNYKLKGRVGDSPLFGAGGYADDQAGAASATGQGEHSMRVLLSKYAVDQIGQGKSAQEAAAVAMQHVNRYFDPSNVGIILVDRGGRIGAAHTTPYMAIGWVDDQGRVQSSMGGGIEGLRPSR